MRDALLDVTLEVSQADLEDKPGSGQILLDKILPVAERMAAEVGGRLRVDRPVELVVQHAKHRLTDENMLLVATRWTVVVPDSARTV